MKLNRKQINVRLPERLLEKMRIIQAYKSRTATIIIEDALEKGLAWYLKQAGAELGYTKEKPLTWEQLAALVKLSVSPKKDDKTEEKKKPQESQEQSEEVSDYELELELYKTYKDRDERNYQDFEGWLVDRVKQKQLTLDEAEKFLDEYKQNTK